MNDSETSGHSRPDPTLAWAVRLKLAGAVVALGAGTVAVVIAILLVRSALG